MRKQKKRINLQYFEGMNLKCNSKFGRTNSIYKKVVFIDEQCRNEFKSFANAYNVQMSTQRKFS